MEEIERNRSICKETSGIIVLMGESIGFLVASIAMLIYFTVNVLSKSHKKFLSKSKGKSLTYKLLISFNLVMAVLSMFTNVLTHLLAHTIPRGRRKDIVCNLLNLFSTLARYGCGSSMFIILWITLHFFARKKVIRYMDTKPVTFLRFTTCFLFAFVWYLRTKSQIDSVLVSTPTSCQTFLDVDIHSPIGVVTFGAECAGRTLALGLLIYFIVRLGVLRKRLKSSGSVVKLSKVNGLAWQLGVYVVFFVYISLTEVLRYTFSAATEKFICFTFKIMSHSWYILLKVVGVFLFILSLQYVKDKMDVDDEVKANFNHKGNCYPSKNTRVTTSAFNKKIKALSL